METKEYIKSEYSRLCVENDNCAVPVKQLPNKIYQGILYYWDDKYEIDGELFLDKKLTKVRIKWNKEKVFDSYKTACVNNGNKPIDYDELISFGGLHYNIIKHYGSKYKLEKELGYHNFDNIEPIITTYVESTPVDNPNFVMKRFGDIENNYTGEEILLTREYTRVWKNKKINRVFSEPIPKKLSELMDDKKFYVGVKINDKSEYYSYNGSIGYDSHYNKILSNTIDVNNPKLWWIIGRWLGDGWLRDGNRKNRKNGKAQWVFVCCGKHEVSDLIAFFDSFQVNAGYHEERTVYKFKITKKEWFDFFSQFGKGAGGKFIPQKVKDLPIHLLEQLIIGYFSADGYHQKKRDVYQCTSVGKRLMCDIQECIEKVYKAPVTFSLYKRKPTCVIEGRTVKQRNTYSLRFKKDVRKQDKAFFEEGYIWYPITYIKKIT